MKTLRKVLVLLASLSLVVTAAGVANAETATVSVSGGTLSVTPANVTMTAITLDGTDQVATSAAVGNSWSAQDSRGTGAGWHLTIDSTDFTDGGVPLRTINVSAADQEFKIQLLDANIAVSAGSAKPTSAAAVLTVIPEAPAPALKFASAALDEGMGSYTLNPNFELEVPAETYVGSGTYTATITVTAVSGP